MKKIWDLSRRRFLWLLSAVGLVRVAPALASRETPKPAPGYRVLTQHQVATLEAIAEQIIPADSDPGARDAGAVVYIDRVLSDEQQSRLPLYTAGLAGADETSQAMFRKRFVELKFDEQTKVLKTIETGKAPGDLWKKVSSDQFFSIVWTHVLEGFYGPPGHGGNKNYASWKMVGFPEH